ncbi:MAG: thiamine pyrophosphate-binding protein, partial [Gemmatimonadota bacterium]|nr:thiamine pyrophosphate-binding protein [Gemmatimonadota bacterium]
MSSVVHMNGGQALAEMFRLHNPAPMFGMGGFQLLPFYDAVRELGLSHTLINDERCGIFAADAWARVTGRPGICDGTLGPGATNLVTGLVESLNAGVPLIVVVGNSNREHSWKNMTQEARQTEILAPAAKALIRIESGNRIPELVRRAYAVATSGRPGPVVLDVPEDIAHGEYDYPKSDFFVDPETLRIPAQRSRPGRDAVARAAACLRGARRPIILAGGGVHLSGAYCELQSFAEDFSIPVAQTLSGKGAIPCIHPLSVGLFGRWSRIANDLIASADCILSVGCKMGEIATKRYDLIPRDVP